MQEFPGDLLEPNYPDPGNNRRLLARSEVERREKYFYHLELGSAAYPLVEMIKQCLDNVPQERPTAERLVTVLEGMREDFEGPCGKLATVDAVRQVMTVKALKEKSVEKVNELTAKDEEIQRLQEQLEVNFILPHIVVNHHTQYLFAGY